MVHAPVRSSSISATTVAAMTASCPRSRSRPGAAAGADPGAAPPRAWGRPRPSASPAIGMPVLNRPKLMPILSLMRVLVPEIAMPIAAAKFDRPREAATRIRAAAAIDVVTSNEPVIHESRAEPSFERSWPQSEAEGSSAAAAFEADASLDAPEIGDKEPELKL